MSASIIVRVPITIRQRGGRCLVVAPADADNVRLTHRPRDAVPTGQNAFRSKLGRSKLGRSKLGMNAWRTVGSA